MLRNTLGVYTSRFLVEAARGGQMWLDVKRSTPTVILVTIIKGSEISIRISTGLGIKDSV